MTMRRTTIAAAAAAAAACIGGATTWALADNGGETTSVTPPDPASAARTSFPGLRPATGEPALPAMRRAHPRPGSVVTLAGPFDDRFEMSHLRLGDEAVTGRLHVTSDVSDLLELQVLAGFYDARGRLLGTARFVHHLDEEHETVGTPHELERFSVGVPARFRDRAASAAVGVPVLVNE